MNFPNKYKETEFGTNATFYVFLNGSPLPLSCSILLESPIKRVTSTLTKLLTFEVNSTGQEKFTVLIY